jgi:ABC-type polysaccharide/polyol phosphate export permease
MLSSIRELFAYRVLIQTLVVQELKVRYRGSALGLLWTLLNPLLLMGIYALVFSVYMRIEMERYAAFLLCGLLPWIWISSSLVTGASSIVGGSGLIKKIYFPPHVLPTVTVMSNLVNFLLSLPILIGFLLFYDVRLGWTFLILPCIIACQFVFTLGLTLIVAAVGVRYRDVPQLLGHLVTFWFFLTPILYPITTVPAQYRSFLTFNPFTPFVVAYQNALMYNQFPSFGILIAIICLSLFSLSCGLVVFAGFRWSLAEEL